MRRKDHTFFDFVLIGFIALYELAILIFSLLWLFTNTFKGHKDGLAVVEPLGINEHVTYGWLFAGAMGGAFYCLRALYRRLGRAYTPIDGGEAEGEAPAQVLNVRTWLIWYLYRPLQGGILSLVLLCLVKSDMLVVGALSTKEMSSYYVLISLGFIAGLGSHELMHKIQEVIQVVFARSMETGSDSRKKVEENAGK
jgi:hypothetical protein